MTDVNTLTIDGKEYPINQFSQNVQNLVQIHGQWRAQMQENRLALAKTEFALRALDVELAQLVAQELKDPKDETVAEAVAETVAEAE